MKIDKTKRRRQRPPLKFSIKATWKQIFIIVLILGVIVTIPLAFEYFNNPNRQPIGEAVDQLVDKFKLESSDENTPFLITLPLINKEIDISILKQNPQLITFAGAGFIFIALIVGITLLRNIKKK